MERDSINDELFQRVIVRDNQIRAGKEQADRIRAMIEALEEITNVPDREIEAIADNITNRDVYWFRIFVIILSVILLLYLVIRSVAS